MKTSACSFAGWGGRWVKGKGKCKGGGINFLFLSIIHTKRNLKPGGTGEELGCRLASSIYYFSVSVIIKGISNIPLRSD